MESLNLPQGWTTTTFDTILNYEQPTAYIVKSTEYDDSFDTAVLTAGKTFIIGYTNEKDGIYSENLPAIIFDDFTTAIQYVTFPFKVKSSAMKILQPKTEMLNKKYIYYYMQTIKHNTTTHKRYWISDYSRRIIPLPPLPEQHRIVAKIDILFSELDNSIELLKAIKTQLAVYRQSVLVWAFKEKQNFISFGEIVETRLGKMLDKDKNKGILKVYLRNINVRWFEFDLDDLLEMKFETDEEEKYSVKKGDLIICEGGEPGRCAIWKSDETIKYQKALHRVRPKEGWLAEYLMYYIKHITNIGIIDSFFTGTGIKHLTGESLKKIPIPICPKPEQQAIVSAIESRLSVCDKLEQTIDQTLALSASLRQSILKKAFEGSLVPQDPNDEPAEKLLERIKTEKAAVLAKQKQIQKRGKR